MADVKTDRKARAKMLKADVPAVFLALRERETPWTAKVLAAVTVCYALSPIDLIPDFVPVLGYLDDLLILPLLVAATVRRIPQPVLERCRARSQDLWREGRPKRWWYALPIAAIWAAVVFLVIRAFL